MLLSAVAALSLAAVGVAAAANVTVSPGGSVTGSGSNWELTLNTARRTFNCSNAGFTATLNRGGTGVTLPFAIATNYQQTFSSCRLTGGISYTDSCTATASLNVTALTASGVTPTSVTGISCVISVSGSCRVNLSGSVPTTYNNAANTLTVGLTGQSIVLTGSTCTTLPNETSALFSNSAGGAFVYSVSPAQTINAS
jgi:hypothetical protein